MRDGSRLVVVFFFPTGRSIIYFILLCFAHNDDFGAKCAFALFDQHRQFVAYPIHLNRTEKITVRVN